MDDLFFNRKLTPMMMKKNTPFDSDEHIFELKHDGARCLAYIKSGRIEVGNRGTDFLSRNHNSFLPTFPELLRICDCVSGDVILDGELIVLRDGMTDYGSFARRSNFADTNKVRNAMLENPTQYVVFDILYHNGKNLTALQLMERKKILSDLVIENDVLIISKFIEKHGIDFYELAASQNQEGIVAKKKTSTYRFNKRVADWQKIKSPTFLRRN